MFGRDDSYSYFSDESNTKTIDVVTPDRLLDNSVSLEPSYVNFYAESLQKDNKEIMALRKYIHHQCGIHLKKVKPFNFQFCLLDSLGCIISKKINSSTIIDCFFIVQIQNDLVW